MALHESVLEEFGLAPLWVRRGMTAPGAQPDTTPARADQSMPVGGEAAMTEDAATRVEHRTASVQAEQAEPPTREDPRRERSAEAPAQAADESRRAPAAAAEPRLQHGDPSSYEDDAPRQQASQQPRPSSEPPAFDAPPDDDFAWFDDPSASAPAPAEARRDTPALPAVHTLDWDALGERVASCQSCRLCEKRTNTVFGVGDRNADWMLIGEAPGENEDRQGEPFVGQAGKLLDNMLHSLALARGTNVYIANVIKCRPPGNRNPQPDEVARCEPYLQRQVALVKPKLIVALGRFAAQSLLKTEASISSLRGRVHTYEGLPVIVTYHPAYLLRSLPDKAKAWADLCLARDTWLAGAAERSSEAE